jgi:hypothetical protein
VEGAKPARGLDRRLVTPDVLMFTARTVTQKVNQEIKPAGLRGPVRDERPRGEKMGFVQIIDFTTSRYDDMRKVMDEWTAATEGKRTSIRWMIGKDRDRPNQYVEVVEFPSSHEAMLNNDLPETNEFSKKVADLCDDVTFWNIGDVEISGP